MNEMGSKGFTDVKWVDVCSLGLSQIYLSEKKLRGIEVWFAPHQMEIFQPLPVHDFGNGRLTLTDGHSRAYTAYRNGVPTVPIVYDLDEIVTCATGRMLYRNDIVWCERFGLRTIADLGSRIVSVEDYQKLWIRRCDRGYDLLTQTTESQRAEFAALRPDLFLYGASEDLKMLYFEDREGNSYDVKNTFEFARGGYADAPQ